MSRRSKPGLDLIEPSVGVSREMSTRGEIRAVVFDMDGVLVNSHPVHRAAWRQFLQSIGTVVSEHELAFILEGRTRTEILRHFLGDLREEDLQRFGRRKDEIFRNMEHEITPVSGVLKFVEEITSRGIACAVAGQ